jgi:precorrin-2/cobalt-factor-2 C20-methyltransferase
MNGKLIGIGAGPGDPELITIKALRCLEKCDVVAVPDADKGSSTVYKIVEQAYPEINDKPTFTVVMPMTHDLEKLSQSHREAADLVESYLKDGKTVGFITLGDPTVYSTYMYVHKLVLADGFEAEIVSGITSFCAAAAKLNISLAERAEMMHVVPSSHGIESALKMPGTKVLMKAGSKMAMVKKTLIDNDMDVKMVLNCGMPDEQIFTSAEQIPDNPGYFSLIIAKDKK